MSRITQAHPWMSVEELKALLKRTNDRRTAQKLLSVVIFYARLLAVFVMTSSTLGGRDESYHTSASMDVG